MHVLNKMDIRLAKNCREKENKNEYVTHIVKEMYYVDGLS